MSPPTASENLARASISARRLRCGLRIAVLLLVVPISCCGGYYLGTLHRSEPTQTSQQLDTIHGLYIDPTTLELGEVWETPCYTAKLLVQNTDNQEHRIVKFETSCDCLAVEPQTLTLPAGARADLAVSLDLTHRQPYQFGLATWPFSVRILPVLDRDFASTPAWELKGTVHSRVSLDAVQLSFVDKCSHLGPHVIRKVHARAHVPIKKLEAFAPPGKATVEVEPFADSGNEFLIKVSPRPELPVGPFQFPVHVRAISLDGEVHACASIDVSGEMQPSWQVTPRMILFGEKTVPSEAEAFVTVRLPCNGWTVDHFETDDADIKIRQDGETTDGLKRLRVVQRISQIGDHKSAIQIIVRRPAVQGVGDPRTSSMVS